MAGVGIGTGLFNTAEFNTERYNEINVDVARVTHPEQVYRLELRNNSGTMLHYLDAWYDGGWVQSVNQPGTIEFSYPLDDSKTADFAFPNQVWVYDSNSTLPLEKFHVLGRKRISNRTGRRTILRGKSIISQLARELITAYDTAGTPTTIDAVLSNWFSNFQTNANTISIGNVDNPIGDTLVEIKIDNQSMLTGIRQLHQMIGGYFVVDPNTMKFHWTRELGERKGQQILRGHNLIDYEEEIDYEKIITRLYAKGKGTEAATKRPLAGTGYVENNTGTYGTIPGVISDPGVDSLNELTDKATTRLQEVSVPHKSYTVNTIDLSQVQGLVDYSFHYLLLGTLVTVIDADLSVEIEQRVIEIMRRLDNPLDVKIQVTDPDSGTASWDIGPGTPAGNSPNSGKFEDVVEQIAELFRSRDRERNEDHGVLWDMEQALGLAEDGFDDIVTLTGSGNGGLDNTDGTPDGDDIAWWDEPGNVGNLLDKIADAYGTDSGGTVLSNTAALEVADTGAAGTAANPSREDHEHQHHALFVPMYRQDSAPTTGLTDGDLWYDTDDDILYCYIIGVWRRISHTD